MSVWRSLVSAVVLLTKGREFESPNGHLEQLLEYFFRCVIISVRTSKLDGDTAHGTKRVRFSVGGYHVGFSTPKHGFESRNRNQDGDTAHGAKHVRFIVGGYHARLSLSRHGFESRNRNQEGVQLKEHFWIL